MRQIEVGPELENGWQPSLPRLLDTIVTFFWYRDQVLSVNVVQLEKELFGCPLPKWLEGRRRTAAGASVCYIERLSRRHCHHNPH